jgi:hypothetical protein
VIDNAVAHVKHLREQGKLPSEAIEHAVQRFGVSQRDLINRVNGYVADRERTQNALAEAKEYLSTLPASPSPTEAERLLRELYEAVTGETLPGSQSETAFCSGCGAEMPAGIVHEGCPAEDES